MPEDFDEIWDRYLSDTEGRDVKMVALLFFHLGAIHGEQRLARESETLREPKTEPEEWLTPKEMIARL